MAAPIVSRENARCVEDVWKLSLRTTMCDVHSQKLSFKESFSNMAAPIVLWENARCVGDVEKLSLRNSACCRTVKVTAHKATVYKHC